jgi:hypothetical protein
MSPGHPLYGLIRSKDLATIVVDGNPDVPSDLLLTLACALHSDGIVPLDKVTLDDLLATHVSPGQSCELVRIIQIGSSLFWQIGCQGSALVGCRLMRAMLE